MLPMNELPKVINLMQHALTEEQELEFFLKGYQIIPLSEEDKAIIKKLITFEDIPSKDDIINRAIELADWAANSKKADFAIIGGAPFFQSSLEECLKREEITPLHAFSLREVVESTNDKGEVIKTSTFKHKGFIVM